jgi:lipopolysaccharide biosynthesis glycosyltransferase
MFPELERMIFLDGDTLIFKDISEMYNLPFNGNYVLGYPFHTPLY